jgi:hypothetical protein
MSVPYQDLRHGSALCINLTSSLSVYIGKNTDLMLQGSDMIFLHRAEVRQARVTAELALLHAGQIAIDQHLNYSSRTSSVPED